MRLHPNRDIPRHWLPFLVSFLLILAAVVVKATADSVPSGDTATPIKHVVIIFGENISYDHYFGTYPSVIKDAGGQVIFRPKDDTPRANGLNHNLLTNNQNSAQPFLITDLLTCNQSNAYKSEQEAYDQGAADEFVEFTEGSGCAVPYEVMGYYDGSIVTALWNYAQNFSISDNFFATTFGATCLGHLNLVSGQTHGAVPANVSGSVLNGSVVANIDPAFDNFSVGPRSP